MGIAVYPVDDKVHVTQMETPNSFDSKLKSEMNKF